MQIKDIKEDNEILKCLLVIETVYGLKSSDEPLVYSSIVDHFRKYYSYMSLDDILRAFSLAFAGKLKTNGKELNLTQYQGDTINIPYIAKILIPFNVQVHRPERKHKKLQASKQLALMPGNVSLESTTRAIHSSIEDYIEAERDGRDYIVGFIHYDYINENLHRFSPAEKHAAIKAIKPLLIQRLASDNERKGKFQRLSPELLRKAQAELSGPSINIAAQHYLTKRWISSQVKLQAACR